MSGSASRRRASLPLLLMLLSGFAGLGYQIVWTRQAALWLGHESAAVLAVVTAFFGGLAVGAWRLGSRIEHSAHPIRWYAACELVIALYSPLLLLAMPAFGAWAAHLAGPEPDALWQWALAFFGTFLLLLPATAAMGATLPAMDRIAATWGAEGQSIPALYAANTLGAVGGVLASGFVLIAQLGLARTSLLCALLNLLCGAAALAVFPASAGVRADRPARPGQLRVLLILALTGFLGIGYEVAVVRVLSQVTEGTVYTFATLLAVYLVGSALGAAAYRRWLMGRGDPDASSDRLLAALGASCVLSTATLWAAEAVRTRALNAFGDGLGAALLAEAAPALLAFGLPTLVMGALFSHLSGRAKAVGVGFGQALGVNTLGAAAAAPVVGLWLAPALGPKLALLLLAAGYLASSRRRVWLHASIWLPAGGALLLAWLTPPLAFVDVPSGGHLISYEDGAMAAVSVVEDADGVARLRIDNRAQEGSSATQRVDGRQAWLPLLLHPMPRRALFLGLGTGVTASTAAEDASLRVDVVELLPEVIRASSHFSGSVAEGAAARLHVVAADARRYVRASNERYDVIVSDNFHPARSGAGSLYTVEHFSAVQQRLASGGVFCQWLPLHQLDRATLRSIARSFLEVYPVAWAMIASGSLETPVLGLVGLRDASGFDLSAVRARLAQRTLAARLRRVGLEDDFAVLGSFVAGPASLRAFVAGAAPNTDDRPVVAYRAPRATYAPEASPADRFIELLRELSIEPNELLAATPDPLWPSRLAAYWAARNRFIEAGRSVRPSLDVEQMLRQAREPLLTVLSISPDFRPAYDPLLAMAKALSSSNVAGARALLSELERLQPARSDAAQLLASLSAAAAPDAADRR